MTAAASPAPAQSFMRVGAHIVDDFVQDMVGEARGALAGWFWHLVLPIAPLGIYLALATFRVFTHPDNINSAAYMTLGATMWMLFSGLVTAPMYALRGKGKLSAQTGYPLIGVVLSKVLGLLFDTAIRVLMVAAILVWKQPLVSAPGLAVLALLAAVPLFFGAGLIVGVFAIAVRDLDRIVPLVLQYGFFLSFAIFPLPLPPGWIGANPFATFIDNIRHMLIFGVFSSPIAYASWCAVGILVLMKGLRFFGRAERVVVGHL